MSSKKNKKKNTISGIINDSFLKDYPPYDI